MPELGHEPRVFWLTGQGDFAAAGFLDLPPGSRGKISLVHRSPSVPLSLPGLTSAMPGAHISVLFIVFLPLLFLLKLHTLPSGYSEEVVTH